MMARPNCCSLFDLVVDLKLTDGLREISELQNHPETFCLTLREGMLCFSQIINLLHSIKVFPTGFPLVAKGKCLYMYMISMNTVVEVGQDQAPASHQAE